MNNRLTKDDIINIDDTMENYDWIKVGALTKVSFATRSEAGRYAANMRWAGHVKDDLRSVLDLQLPPIREATTEAGKDAQRIINTQSFNEDTLQSASGQWEVVVVTSDSSLPTEIQSTLEKNGDSYVSDKNIAKVERWLLDNPEYTYEIAEAAYFNTKEKYFKVKYTSLELVRTSHKGVDPNVPHDWADTKILGTETFLHQQAFPSYPPTQPFDEADLNMDTSPRNVGGIPQGALYRWERAQSDKDEATGEMPYNDSLGWYASRAAGLPEPYAKPSNSYRHYYKVSESVLESHATALLDAASRSGPQPTLWRGVGGSHQGEKLTGKPQDMDIGDTFDVGLGSTSRDIIATLKYAGGGAGATIMRIRSGSKGLKLSKSMSRYPHDQEVITTGSFRVTGKETVTLRNSNKFAKAKAILRAAPTLYANNPRREALITRLKADVVRESLATGREMTIIDLQQERVFG